MASTSGIGSHDTLILIHIATMSIPHAKQIQTSRTAGITRRHVFIPGPVLFAYKQRFAADPRAGYFKHRLSLTSTPPRFSSKIQYTYLTETPCLYTNYSWPLLLCSFIVDPSPPLIRTPLGLVALDLPCAARWLYRLRVNNGLEAQSLTIGECILCHSYALFTARSSGCLQVVLHVAHTPSEG